MIDTIVNETDSNSPPELNRLITLSPLTEMARNFHLRNGAVELQVNEKTQNFEYKI